MKIIKKEKRLCHNCMEEHDVDTVEVLDKGTFKGEMVEFRAVYEYCKNTEEYSQTEDTIRVNSLAQKDAYRKKVGLLTSEEIKAIREKYAISQKDFSEVLGWGGVTIIRYENHQVQDRAHDDILRKIDADPKWFLQMIDRAKEGISAKAYALYHHKASLQFNGKRNQYLKDSICAIYADYDDETVTGGMELNLDKVVEVINYLAMKVNSLHKVKLMKMLWYSDILNYKRYAKSITGLAYSALPMGAVPEGYEQIVLLQGISFDTVMYEENVGYKFKPTLGVETKSLSSSEIETIDEIIIKLGHLSSGEIVKRMHEEDAYRCTASSCIIPYTFAEQLSID